MSRKSREKAKKQKVSKVGLPQGSSVYIGVERSEEVVLSIFSYDANTVSHHSGIDINNIRQLDADKVHWVNIDGIHDVKTVHDICIFFGIHALTEEDILNSLSRPKCEIFEDYIYSGIKMLKNEKEDVIIEDEQLSLILKNNILITFQETQGDVFEPIRHRLSMPESRIRRKSADYLFLALHDVTVDNYISIVDVVDEMNQNIEAQIIEHPSEVVLKQIQSLKTDLIYLKKYIFPVRESINKIMRSDSIHISKDNYKYFNDLYDHLIYVTESIEMQREVVVSHRELYMSHMSNKMNAVMQVLTIVTTVFIPLSFIAGVYGMNFKNMPELNWQYGYFYVLGLMFIVGMGMVAYFRKKKWL
jgi:magnesium transporter